MAAFDERLNVYIKELVADLASPSEGEKTDLGNLGEPRFSVAEFRWYGRFLKADGTQVKVSRSLFGPAAGDIGRCRAAGSVRALEARLYQRAG